jgi:hypothetical protein
MPGLVEPARDERGQAPLVLDDQDPHGTSLRLGWLRIGGVPEHDSR